MAESFDFGTNMRLAQEFAERGDPLHVVVFLWDAWRWTRNLPPGAEACTKEILVLANRRDRARHRVRRGSIDIPWKIGHPKQTHAAAFGF